MRVRNGRRLPVPLEFRERAEAYGNAFDQSAISSAAKGSVYRDVPLSQLIATQRTVNTERVRAYTKPPAEHSPLVLEHGGKFYLHNGHHRAAAELAQGHATLRARVATLDKPRKFAEHAPAGSLLMIEPRAMAASYTPRDEPCIEIVEGGIAVLHIDGPLESKPGPEWAYCDDYESIMERFRAALECSEVRAVMLKIDSPGGMAAGLNASVDAMRKLKDEANKLVVAYADEKCCSAAYALACVADKIYIPAAAEIGSIGVTSTLVDVTEANKAAGHNVVVITSGERKADGNPDVPMTDEAIAHVQRRVDRLADLYYRLVEKARGIPVAQVRALEADTFDGKDAVNAGLADAIWTLEETLNAMRVALDAGGQRADALDDTTGDVTNNVTAPGPKASAGAATTEKKMAKKTTSKASKAAKIDQSESAKHALTVEAARKALKRALAMQAASEKTPPADAEEEEEEERKIIRHEKRTEEIEEEVPPGSEPSDASSEPSEEEEEEETDEADEEEADEEEETDEEEEDEEASKKAADALLALAQDATGKKGQRAIGAIAALLAEGRRASKRVQKISAERAKEKKALAIQSALATRRITRHEAKDLAGKSSAFVRDFLSMRSRPLIATDEDELHAPSAETRAAALPMAILKQIAMAVSGVPEKDQHKLRKKLIAAHRERLSSANGAGRF